MQIYPDLLPIAPLPVSRVWRSDPLWVRVPGSKSITNRALLLAALTPEEGERILEAPLVSRDTELMANALEQLGVKIQRRKSLLSLMPPLNGFAQKADLFVGNAGTAARFLTAFLALQPEGIYRLDGDAEMRRRPMAGLIRVLESGGTRFDFLGERDCFPFVMRTCRMQKISGAVEVDASASSQILSAVLMTAPFWPARPIVRLVGKTVSKPFVNLTCEMMRQYWGADAVRQPVDGSFTFGDVQPQPQARHYRIEPDATAASYFLSLPLVSPIRIGVRGLHPDMLQGDLAYVRVLQKAGVHVQFDGRGGIAARCGESAPIHEDFNAFSDTFLTLAALAPLLPNPTTLTGLAHTRHQETDRLEAMAAQLRRLGQRVETTRDSLHIVPDKEALRRVSAKGPVPIATYKDHRVAMSFGVLGCYDLHGDGRPWLAIEDPACCGKTFPEFFSMLDYIKKQAAFLVVAIDGGAASGKSSTARGLSEKLNLMHVDTGSHYRALTWALLNAGVKPDDDPGIERALAQLNISSRIQQRSSKITLDGIVPEDGALRTEQVNAHVSKFAAVPRVRAFLKDYQRGQREVALDNGFSGLVMEGRDIGSVIFPDAPLRFFLEADPAVRAARRAAEGQTDAVADRDRMDATRKTAPLRCPDGAERIDNSKMPLDDVIAHIAARVRDWSNAAAH